MATNARVCGTMSCDVVERASSKITGSTGSRRAAKQPEDLQNEVRDDARLLRGTCATIGQRCTHDWIRADSRNEARVHKPMFGRPSIDRARRMTSGRFLHWPSGRTQAQNRVNTAARKLSCCIRGLVLRLVPLGRNQTQAAWGEDVLSAFSMRAKNCLNEPRMFACPPTCDGNGTPPFPRHDSTVRGRGSCARRPACVWTTNGRKQEPRSSSGRGRHQKPNRRPKHLLLRTQCLTVAMGRCEPTLEQLKFRHIDPRSLLKGRRRG